MHILLLFGDFPIWTSGVFHRNCFMNKGIPCTVTGFTLIYVSWVRTGTQSLQQSICFHTTQMTNLKTQTVTFVQASQVISILRTRMQKIIPPLLALMIHLALCDFIFMMRKCKVYSTSMDVQLLSKHCTVTIFSWSVSRTLQKLFTKRNAEKSKMK